MRLIFVLTVLLFLPLITLGQVCNPPILTNAPDSIIESHCNEIIFDFNGQKDVLDDSANILYYYSNFGEIDSLTGEWTYDPVTADFNNPLDLEIYLVSDTCVGTALVTLLVTNSAPVITPDIYGGDILPFDPLWWNLNATDADQCDTHKWSVYATGSMIANIDSLTGFLKVIASDAGPGTVEIMVTDGFNLSTRTIGFSAIATLPPQISIKKETQAIIGQIVDIEIDKRGGSFIRATGFQYSISYPKEIMNLINVFPSPELINDCGWEYFTYKINLNNPYHDIGVVKATMIASLSGNYETIYCNYNTDITLQFLITIDKAIECMSFPIQFYWDDANDNVIYEDQFFQGKAKNSAGYIFNEFPVLDPIFENDISDSTVGYPTILGPQNNDCCEDDSVYIALPGLQFYNGSISIPCYDTLTPSGDLNIDGLRFKASDLVLYANYFIYGMSVFNPNYVEAQIWASDVNGDGRTLSVADLEYFIRIISGDNLIYPKTTPVETDLINNNGILNISEPMGAVHIITQGDCTPQLLVDNMQMQYHYDTQDDITRILIYNMTELNQTFSGDFINIGEAKITSIELATYDGTPVTTTLIPKEFTLYQNYPNPFNPTTTIKFALPEAGQVKLSIYNINGQLVDRYNRFYESPGEYEFEWDATGLSSGIYLYRLTHNLSEQNRKMILLK